MSARSEANLLSCEETQSGRRRMTGPDLEDAALESFLQNVQSHTAMTAPPVAAQLKPRDGARRRPGLPMQDQLGAWLEQRELLRNEIKRGRECLDQVRQELAASRARLEEWAIYERTCGRNPLSDCMQSLLARERIAQFLPGWLKRREEQLKAVSRNLERCAKQNGLEQVL